MQRVTGNEEEVEERQHLKLFSPPYPYPSTNTQARQSPTLTHTSPAQLERIASL